MKVEAGKKLKIYIDFPQEEIPVELLSSVRWVNDYGAQNDIGVMFGDIQQHDLDKLKTAMLVSPSAVG